MKISLLYALKLFLHHELTLKNRFKHFFRLIMPEAYTFAVRKWGRNNKKFAQLKEIFISQNGKAVLDGPFAGMVYLSCPVYINTIPKLLGCYEAELHSVLGHIIKTHYAEIINIGCGEGYYAVGLAMRLPKGLVYAFDTDPVARQLCKDLARANNVTDRVVVEKECDIKKLSSFFLEGALIICDCEGYELEILRPDLIPGLENCDMLVELHDFVDPNISRTIEKRFDATHDITLVNSTERDPFIYPQLRSFSSEDKHLVVSEFRPGVMRWAFMESRMTRKK